MSVGADMISRIRENPDGDAGAAPGQVPDTDDFTSAAPAGGGSLTLAPVGEVTRPGGQVYRPRKIGGAEDLALLRHWRDRKKHPLLYGPPGTGKTAMAEAAFAAGAGGRPGLQTIVGGLNTQADDFTGTFVPAAAGDGYEWVPGPLHRALLDDVPLFVDEIFLIDPRVLSLLYPLMDGRPLTITANPRLDPITPGPGFFVIGAGNPDVPGAVFSEALRRRFSHHIEVTTDWTLARELGVPADIITVAKNLDTRRRNGLISGSPQLAQLLDFRDDEREMGPAFAASALLGKMPREDHDIITEALAAKYGNVTPLALGPRHKQAGKRRRQNP